MPASDRPPSFPFYPRDFITDEAVSLMTPEQRGGYVMLLCHAWLRDEPGILPDDDAVLACLSGLGERWPACREAIARAFEQRDSKWLQHRMLQERAAQLNRYKKSRKGARLTNARRWGSVAQRHDSDTIATRSAVSLASAFALEPKESTPSRNTVARDGIVGFTEFWQLHPRKKNKGDALKAWKALHADGALREAIMAGLLRAKDSPEWTKDGGRFIPYPATWIRARGWEDEPAERRNDGW